MDDIDRAQAHIERLDAARLSQLVSRRIDKPSATECKDCGEPIPLARQMAIRGVTLCVECQGFYERRNRHG